MYKLDFILLQAGVGGGDFSGTLLAVFVVIAIMFGIFLLIRSVFLWYWKVDVIVRNQETQTTLMKFQNQPPFIFSDNLVI